MLGITGGVGTGKTTVSKAFEKLGAKRISSDDIARKYTSIGSPVRESIIDIFGEESFPEGSDANRSLIAKLTFNDPSRKTRLEKLLHPLIRRDFNLELNAMPDHSIVAWEVPLLFETDAHTICDASLCVYLSKEEAWKRVEGRGGMPMSDFELRWKSQMDIEKKKSLSDFVIINDNTYEGIEKAVLDIYKGLEKRVHKK
ncbi:dephospho-CoA kinase [Leptospira sp. GIMC2001]|uniref:dephospho-CoA kinase n=1 Tax=Leptospira sp. GIMC2001 TaxID=1513297 RepID=UPI002349FC7F|nr:dephospho-CoA kinase [Leptospira sp. GIMC2001]WCL50901.1 dephospho-CoA kinase [Leptospira sp. GIMC2001]